MRVCLVIEGSYPFITGGVSSWVHELISGLPRIEFVLFTFSPQSDQELRYKLPPNVSGVTDVVLTRNPRAAKGGGTRGAGRDRVLGILASHLSMFSGNSPNLERLIGSIPEGTAIHRESVLDERAGKFVQAQNRARNPIYPYSDYFWAWKSSHDLIFNVLAAKAPEADVYHSLSTGFAGLAALAAKLRKGKPFLLTEHGLYHKEREIEIRKAAFVRGYQRDLWIRIYNSVARMCYEGADLCTSLFEENRRSQLELGASPERTVVIPNGIDVARYSVRREKRDEEFHVVFVGRIVPIKDVKTFIVAAKLVLERIPTTRFHLVGPDDEDPAYAAECRRLAADLKIEDRLDFTGRANVLEYYKFLDVVVLTSVREAQPLVILEAYAAGIPCVSTDVGNVSELLEGDRRFIASSKDAAKIAEGIEYVLEHPEEMAVLAARNRTRTVATYEKRELLARYGELYARFEPAYAAEGA
ncbi:MAG: GT4 family glycosyltransferase PelF [Rectinemataceae bacterium]|jgi:glycosyltransferase involved in cell wall biosynthesis